MLYEMLTGRRPFAGDSPLSVLSSILKDTPAPVGHVRPDLPADLDRILRRCLAKDPARRYQTAIDLKTELEDLESAATAARLADASASTPSVVVPRRPRVGRYWRVAALTIVSLGVALVLTGRFGWPNWTRTESGTSIVHPVFTQLTSAPAAELFPSLFSRRQVDRVCRRGRGQSRHLFAEYIGTDPRRLVDADTLLPTWSPHGLRIAYGGRLGIDRQGDLLTVPASGGEPVPVTTDRFRDWNPVWAPDGTYLYFLSDRAGSMNIWRVAIDEASGQPRDEPEPITSPAPFAAHLTISADGRRLA